MSDLERSSSRLCAAGPLLYIGLVLMTDPVSFVTMAENVAMSCRAFENRLRGDRSTGLFERLSAHSERPANRIAAHSRISRL